LIPLLQILLLVGLDMAPAEAAPADRSGATVLARYLAAEKDNVLRGISMDTTFYAKVPKLDKDASLSARRSVSPTGEVRYETTKAMGDKTILKEVIARVINAEQEAPLASYAQISVNESNYRFKHKAVIEKDGHVTYVFEVIPKKKRVGLFKGDIWVDSDSGLLIREAGHLVKSPSVVVKRVDFVREYEIKDNYSMPLRTRSTSDTRLWGKAEVSVLYSHWSWDGAQPARLLPQH